MSRRYSDMALATGPRAVTESPSVSAVPVVSPKFSVARPRKMTKAWGSPSKDKMSLTEKEEVANNQPSHLHEKSSLYNERKSENIKILTLVRTLIKKKDQSISRLRWLKAMKLVCNTLHISHTMAQRSYEISAIHPNFIDIGDNGVIVPEPNKGYFINKTMFELGSKYGFNMVHNEEQTLMMEPEERTEQQISTLLRSLQLIQAFCQYPLRTQRQIAKHATYSRIKKKRVIIRQGQEPLHYYFILCGQAVVTEVVPSEHGPFCQTHSILTEGEGFGDIAITELCQRTATVTSRSKLQLLILSKKDYISIFLPERFTDWIPDYIKYLAKCSWMKGFPVEKLLNNPRKCSARYFRHRQLIVADSTDEDYLYVIHNGRCQVLMLIDLEKTSWRDLEPLWKKPLNQSNKYLAVFQAQDKPVSTSDEREQSFVPSSTSKKRTILPGTPLKTWDQQEQNQVPSVLNRAITSAPASRKNSEEREQQQRRFSEVNQSAPASWKNITKREHQQRRFTEGSVSFRKDTTQKTIWDGQEQNQVSSVPNRAIKSALASRNNTEEREHQQRRFSEGSVSFRKDTTQKTIRNGQEQNQVPSVLNRAIKSALASRKNTEEREHQQRRFSEGSVSFRKDTTQKTIWDGQEQNQVSSVPNRAIKSALASRKNTEEREHQQRRFSEGSVSFRKDTTQKTIRNGQEHNQVPSGLNRAIKSALASSKNTEKSEQQQRKFSEDNQLPSVLNRAIKSAPASRKNTEKRDLQQRRVTEGSVSFSEDSKSFRDSREANQAPTAALHKKSTNTRPVSSEQNEDSLQSTSPTKKDPSFRGMTRSAVSPSRKKTTGSLLPDFVKDTLDFANLRPTRRSILDDPIESMAEADLDLTVERLMKEMRSFADDADTLTREQRRAERNSSLHSEIPVILVDENGNVVPGGNSNYNSNSENYHINTKGNTNKDISCDSKDSQSEYRNSKYCDSYSKDSNSKDGARTNASAKGHAGSASNTNKGDHEDTVGTNSKSKSMKIQPEARKSVSLPNRLRTDICNSPDSSADEVFVSPDVSGSSGSSGTRTPCYSETVTISNLRRRPRRPFRPPEKKGEISSWAKRRLYTVPLECRPRKRCRSATGKKDLKKIFVEMEILRPGDVFGFDQLNLPLCIRKKTHKVSLVSEGAEVIMIHKRFFVQHANIWVQHAVQGLTNPYVSPEKVQYARRMHVAWEKYQEKIKEDYKYSGVIYFQPGPTLDPLASVGMRPDTR